MVLSLVMADELMENQPQLTVAENEKERVETVNTSTLARMIGETIENSSFNKIAVAASELNSPNPNLSLIKKSVEVAIQQLREVNAIMKKISENPNQPIKIDVRYGHEHPMLSLETNPRPLKLKTA